MTVVTLQLLFVMVAIFSGGCAIGYRAESDKVPVAGFMLLLVGVVLLCTLLFPAQIGHVLGQH